MRFSIVLPLLLSLTVSAAYPAFKDAGFRNCALIYGKETRTAADLMPLVVETSPDGDIEGPYLFDAFLFLMQKINDIRTENGATRKADWEKAIDTWFAPGRDLAELNRAVAAAVKVRGEVAPRKVILMIPWMDPAVADFGDVDGDGKSENLKLPADRAKVAGWFIRECEKRFQGIKHRHLLLHGFYWMRESMPEDPSMIKVVTDEIRRCGYKSFWIPYFRAEGFEKWRAAGFDAAWLQPNYAFTSAADGGGTLRNRLDIAADLAFKNGMGVEVELRRSDLDEAGRLILRRTFDAGARNGFQKAPQAWYFGTEMMLHRSGDPANRVMYAELARYVGGAELRLPAHDRWERTEFPDKTVYSAEFGATAPVGLLEIALDKETDPLHPWRGTVTAEVRRDGKWEYASWAYRGPAAARDGDFQMLPLRLNGENADALRLTFSGPKRPPVGRIDRDFPLPPRRISLSTGKSYSSNLPTQAATYPDRTGRQLLDGITRSPGFSAYVGWHGVGRVEILFDFGPAGKEGGSVYFDEVLVHTRQDRSAAVNFPPDPLLFLSAGEFQPGIGDPAAFEVALPDKIKTEHLNVKSDYGVVRFAVKPPDKMDRMLFSSSLEAWLMISEFEFRRGGNPVPGNRFQYRFLTPPARTRSGYGDDGRLLTDGEGTDAWTASKVVGVNDGRPIEVIIDLGRTLTPSRATVWSFGGGVNGIYAPKSARVALSDDKVVWGDWYPVTIPALTEDRQSLVVLPCRAEFPGGKARYVKFEIQGARGWCMLSEISVD